jgi:biotin transport system substrate-specific component
MPAVRTLTLSEIAWPESGLARDALLIAWASFATAVAAQIAIPLPWSPVPITGQTFAVLLSGAALGARRAFLAQLLYLAEGSVGLPAFAGGTGGVAVLLGPTGGYLMAFPVGAAITGALAERGWDRRFATMFAAMLLGSVVIFAGGLAGLSRFVPTEHLLALGLLPFVPGDLVKAGLAAAAIPAVWRVVGRRSGTRA